MKVVVAVNQVAEVRAAVAAAAVAAVAVVIHQEVLVEGVVQAVAKAVGVGKV